MPKATTVLLLGQADSGKTTFTLQLHGRLKRGVGALVEAKPPASLAALEVGLGRLEQGLAAEHTPTGTAVEQILHAKSADGTTVDIRLPDYAGEDLEAAMVERRLPDRWVELAQGSEHWLLLLRASRQPTLPDVIRNPVAALSVAAASDDDGADDLPLDLWAVELLQMMRYARQTPGGQSQLPSLTVVLSCWDELDLPERTEPASVAKARLGLLISYCRSHWGAAGFSVVGLSAQGMPLDNVEPAEDYLDIGPQEIGWFVDEDGTRRSDLTRLVALP